MAMLTIKQLQERIDQSVTVNEETGCWEWNRYCNKINGYGQFWIGTDSNNKSVWKNAHRQSYEIFYGPVPKGLEVAHRCHNPACVNPNHLVACTHKENIAMSVEAGRRPKGEGMAMAKLTDSIVQTLREGKVFAGLTVASIARILDVDYSTIRDAMNGKTWKHVTGSV